MVRFLYTKETDDQQKANSRFIVKCMSLIIDTCDINLEFERRLPLSPVVMRNALSLSALYIFKKCNVSDFAPCLSIKVC